METNVSQILKKLQQICSRQEKCKADIVDYLFKHEVPQQFHAAVIKSLVDDKFIDEVRYAGAAVQDKFRLNRWGRIKIRYFLRSKRIPDNVIEKALILIDGEEYNKMMLQELKKKTQSLREEDREVRTAKLLQYAASKGFEEELVWKVIKKEG